MDAFIVISLRRMNPRRRCVELRTSAATVDADVLQKGADFLKAFMLGFDVPDALALLRLDDLFVESFDVTDVKLVRGSVRSVCLSDL